MTVQVNVKNDSARSIENQIVGNVKLKKEFDVEPRDKFYAVYVLFLLLGLMHFIPYTFFVTANAYWMDKFRNTSDNSTDAASRTPLQANFASGSSITQSVPSLIFTLASSLFGHKIRARRRVLMSLGTMTVCFVIAWAFVEINTDNWQTAFFGLTMGMLCLISGANATMQIGILVILAKFPQHYMKAYIFGQGIAGLFNSIIQVFSLAIGTSTITSAMIYFGTGTTLMAISLILFYCSKFNKLYNYYAESMEEDTAKGLMTFSEMKSVFVIIWPCIAANGLLLLTIYPTYGSITPLVVSEFNGNGDPWNDKYFVPVITFLFSDVVSLSGRVASTKLKQVENKYMFPIFMLVRMFIFIPLIYFCNAQPRHHLPVLLPHDWQYITVIGLFGFSNGYAGSLLYLEIRRLVQLEKLEDAFKVVMSCSAFLAAVLSPLSVIAVDVL